MYGTRNDKVSLIKPFPESEYKMDTCRFSLRGKANPSIRTAHTVYYSLCWLI